MPRVWQNYNWAHWLLQSRENRQTMGKVNEPGVENFQIQFSGDFNSGLASPSNGALEYASLSSRTPMVAEKMPFQFFENGAFLPFLKNREQPLISKHGARL